MFLFLFLPVSYGWGYRGWGPPYPRYLQRRRAEQAPAGTPGTVALDHHAWGWRGDAMWMFLLVALLWGIAVFTWW